MIQARTAYTAEIDDPEAAARDILRQLALGGALRASSIGFLSCYTEFTQTGAAKAICEALPFPVIGMTTAGAAVPAGLGELGLSIMVLTSDEAVFAAGVSGSLLKEPPEYALEKAYRAARAALPREPALMIVFAPILKEITGERILRILTAMNPGLPVFGAQAVDYIDINLFSKSFTLFNGENRRDALSFALVCGEIRPSFFVHSISTIHIQKQRALITKASGNQVMEVNGMLFRDYLEKIGMLGLSEGAAMSFPFVVDYGDTFLSVPRAVYSMTREGHAIFSGSMPEGATLAIGDIDYTDVLHTAKEALSNIIREGGSCVLFFSCLIRYMALGPDTVAEMELLRSTMRDAQNAPPYLFSYTGGEFCPVYSGKERAFINRCHYCSFICCVF
ncbi:MAG: FIST C-terminal domain-containing protein [Spirochaetaceae bacterium]|jgi:hypothetical protein|nr:FIST C-terminal domain-containing protein [Spirochaetaceae bacterium]